MTEAKATIDAKAPAHIVGSNPNSGNVFTRKDPAWTVPNAKKQLLHIIEAPAITVPATSDFSAVSTNSLKLEGASQSDDS